MSEYPRVRLPRLLKNELNGDGATLRERARLSPGELQITLNMQPLSTVSMRVPEDGPDVKLHDWAEVYNQHGSVGIYRVVNIQPTYGKEISLTLNHALDVLNDSHYVGELDFTGTVTNYLTALLNAQTQKLNGVAYWQLGTVEDTGSWKQEISNDNILELVKEIPEEHQDFMYTFDFSVFPWRLNLVRRPDTVLSEFRMNRNIESCKPAISDTELCTQLILSVTTYTGSGSSRKSNTTFEIHNDAQAQADFGIVQKTAGIDTDTVPLSQKAAWVADYFERHNCPTVQLSVDGQDLKELTGVNIDEMHLGYLCRVALPRYNTIFNERIVSIRYPDALNKPTIVNVSLANRRETAEDSIASAQKEAKRASKTGGKAKKKAEKNSATIEENVVRYNRLLEATDKKVVSTMTATGVLLDENNDPVIGPDGLYVFDTTGPGAALSSRVTQMAGQIQTEVTARTAQGQTFSSAISQLANKIALVVTGEGANAQVSSAAIILAVNGNTGSSATISADKVNLEGYVTATYIDTEKAVVDSLISNTGCAQTIRLTGQTGMVATGAINVGSVSSTGAVSAGSYSLTSAGGNNTALTLKAVSFGGVMQGNISLMGSGSDNTLAVPDAVSNLKIVDNGNNSYTLQKQTYSSDTWTDVGSFNRAASVQISGHWSGRNYIVTATPTQLNTPVGIVYDGLVATGSISKSGKNVSRDFIVYSDDGNGNADSIIMTKTVTISASSVYDDGYLDGRPTSGTAGGRTSGVSGYVHDFTINRAEGNAVVLAIDCSSIYSTARSGYTYGTFTLVSVTLQGQSYGSITPINESSEMHLGNATELSPASGSGVTPTKHTVSVATRNGSYNLRGSTAYKLQHYGDTYLYVAPTTGAQGWKRDWYYIDSGGDSYYKANGTGPKYDIASQTYYDVGSSYEGKTLYEKGDKNIYRRVIDSGGTTFYTAGTAITNLRRPGSTVTDTYYTKS